MDAYNLPFKVGQTAEARSFVYGYRGAWFRCKIKEIGKKNGAMGHAVEYYDFPGEKVRWTKLFQFGRFKVRTLMIRPQFPPVCHEDELSDINSISEVAVILNDVWKVGDLVDWWSDGCYWSGRLTEALGPEKFRIELFPPPAGEGLSYEAFCKDLRPSLDWSPQHGSENQCSCARIVKSAIRGSSVNTSIHEGKKECDAPVSFDISTKHLLPPHRSEKMSKSPLSKTVCVEIQPVKSTTACMDTEAVEMNKYSHVTDGGIGKTSHSDSVASLHHGGVSAEVAGNTVEKDSHHDNGASKKMRTNRSITLNSMSFGTIEAALVDLEELVNRVKWMKDILKFGMPLPDSVQPSWKFVEHRVFLAKISS